MRAVLLALAMTACSASQTVHRAEIALPYVPTPLPAVQAAKPVATTSTETGRVLPREPRFTFSPHPDRDDAVARDLQKIDVELKAKFDFDTGHQHFKGTAQDLFGQIDRRTGQYISVGDWPKASNEREAFAHRLDALIEQQPSPQYLVAALVRKASLADSMWQGITTLEQRGFSVFTPSQVNTLNQTAASCAQPPGCLVNLAQDIREKVEHAFAEKRDEDTRAVAALAIGSYAWAIAFARHFSVTEPDIDRARSRLAAFPREQVLFLLQSAEPPAAIAGADERVNFDLLALPSR